MYPIFNIIGIESNTPIVLRALTHRRSTDSLAEVVQYQFTPTSDKLKN